MLASMRVSAAGRPFDRRPCNKERAATACRFSSKTRVFQLEPEHSIEMEDVERCLWVTRSWTDIEAKRKYFASRGIDFGNVQVYYHVVKRYNKLLTPFDKDKSLKGRGLVAGAAIKSMAWALRTKSHDMLVWSWFAFLFIVGVLLDDEKTYSSNVLPFSKRRINHD